MAGEVKSLAKDTVIYGLSSIVGRFLNWLLVPLYTAKLATGHVRCCLAVRLIVICCRW